MVYPILGFFFGNYYIGFLLLMMPYARRIFAWSLGVFVVGLLRLLNTYLLIGHRFARFEHKRTRSSNSTFALSLIAVLSCNHS